jgi:CDP-diglyceride synthetase
MDWLKLETNERKNISLWVMFGGCIIFTLYAVAGLWLVASYPNYVFWLAVIAHIQIFSIMAGYIAQLVKRRISAGKDGVSITDHGACGDH